MRNPVPNAAIRGELARAGVEFKEVAAWLGLAPSGITKRMAGDIKWRMDELQTVAARLDVPVARLIDEPAARIEPGSAVAS